MDLELVLLDVNGRWSRHCPRADAGVSGDAPRAISNGYVAGQRRYVVSVATGSVWIQLLSIGIPAIASIGAAIVAGRAARRARLAEHQAARLLALDERTSTQRIAVYIPLIEALGNMLVPSRSQQALANAENVMGDFQNLVIVWGSDDVVQSFYRFRRAANTNPPAMITMRLTGDLLIAMRRDIAWPDTDVGALEILGSRITDLVPGGTLEQAFTMPFDQLAAREGWTPPWETPTAA